MKLSTTILIWLAITAAVIGAVVLEASNRRSYSTDCFAEGGDMVTNNEGILSCWKNSGKRVILEREIVNKNDHSLDKNENDSNSIGKDDGDGK